ncbi:MAG: lipoprotein [Alphaproteobacteria bacterium]
MNAVTLPHTRPLATVRIFALLLLVTAALAACGKKGDPIPPEGENVTYDRQYPTSE